MSIRVRVRSTATAPTSRAFCSASSASVWGHFFLQLGLPVDLVLRGNQAVFEFAEARWVGGLCVEHLARWHGVANLAVARFFVEQFARGVEHLGRVFNHVAPGNDFERDHPRNGHGGTLRVVVEGGAWPMTDHQWTQLKPWR